MKYCVICQQNVERFLPYKNGSADLHPVLRALQCVGSDADNFLCPHCSSTDRERHLFIYLSLPNILDRMRGGKVLHFAPERCLRLLVDSQQPQEYVMADMSPRDPAVRQMNMQEIGFPDAYFDFVIANHVLEHVGDDEQAISELTRVLKPGGLAILQTPYSSILPSTLVEKPPGSPITRDIVFGETDHMRLYGTDVFSRIAACGLKFIGGDHQSLRIHVDPVRTGINPMEPFFLFEK